MSFSTPFHVFGAVILCFAVYAADWEMHDHEINVVQSELLEIVVHARLHLRSVSATPQLCAYPDIGAIQPSIFQTLLDSWSQGSLVIVCRCAVDVAVASMWR